MEGIIGLFLALPVALVALGAVLAGIRRRPPSVEDNPGHCSSCETPMSLRRVPLLKSHAVLGGLPWRVRCVACSCGCCKVAPI
jgi:hypothetical protein